VVGISNERLTALLCNHSAFSFGAATATPTTLVRRAAELGYRSLALTDTLNVSGAVELTEAASAHGLQAIIGATIPVRVHERLVAPLVLIATSRNGYTTLNTLITHAHAGDALVVPWPVLLQHTQDLICLTGGREGFPTQLLARRELVELAGLIRELKGAFRDRLYLQLYHDLLPWDGRRARVLRRFARDSGLPTVAAPLVRHTLPHHQRLLDALTCARLGITVDVPHPQRPQNEAAAMPDPAEVQRRLPFPEAHLNANWVAEQARFELLPERLIPPKARIRNDVSAQTHLEARCFEALLQRYQGDALSRARAKLEQELTTIRALGLADFFLVTAEVSDHCRRHGILAAGRGSAAASICCYLLGITRADPVAHNLLFERFLHTGKRTMPDVDIDISSARRDEVLAWVEHRFGPDTQAMVANKITYRLPLAIQDLGRALGIPAEQRNQLTRALGRDYRHLPAHRAEEAQVVFDEVLGGAPVQATLLGLLKTIEHRHPRHLAPHSGGVVLSREPLAHYSPLQRSSGGIRLLQFDKDDAEALGLIKLDLLGLRMLAALEHAREEVFHSEGTWIDLDHLPDDPAVWTLIANGETMGLFQIESPSQVNIARSMRSRNLKDLAHQIALIRPGPIQSGTVHPYLRRKQGLEPIRYWHPSLEPILAKSYGVLLFQEDVLRIAVHFAGMDWVEADRFRKHVSGFRDLAELEPYRARFVAGAIATQGASEAEAIEVFEAIKAYQGYGFAESHAWAFALHAYASAYLRLHHPAAFMAAILTEAPGMWPAATKRQEARAWGVPFLPIDIATSGLHYRVERDADNRLAVRPPLTAIKGISAEFARHIVTERLAHGPFPSVPNALRRVPGDPHAWEALARAGAFDALSPRRDALYAARVSPRHQHRTSQPLFEAPVDAPLLTPLQVEERYLWDHATARLSSLDLHALDLIRNRLRELGAITLWQVRQLQPPRRVRTAGLVVSRQRPPTAGGFAFFVLEDGPNRAQLIISPQLWEEHRTLLRDARILVSDVLVEATGYQSSLRAESLSGFSS
jgi:error-prone DNA polymerase